MGFIVDSNWLESWITIQFLFWTFHTPTARYPAKRDRTANSTNTRGVIIRWPLHRWVDVLLMIWTIFQRHPVAWTNNDIMMREPTSRLYVWITGHINLTSEFLFCLVTDQTILVIICWFLILWLLFCFYCEPKRNLANIIWQQSHNMVTLNFIENTYAFHDVRWIS